jgi:ATP-dependent RNA/DNA helicase IGHMBP2
MPPSENHWQALRTLLSIEHRATAEKLSNNRRTLSLRELESLGQVILDVAAQDERTGLGGRCLVTLSKESGAPMAKLDAGDCVTVAPRKAAVDDAPQATVVRAARNSVTLAFDRRPPDWVFEGRLRMDVMSNDVGFERQRQVIDRFEAMNSGVNFERRAILLGEKPPRFELRRPIPSPRPLNQPQQDAVELALSARDFALIHGPPGTGKSSVLAEVAVQAVARGQRVLCTAASNAAVDHLLECCLSLGIGALRVGHPARVLPHLQQHTLDVLVEEHPDRLLARDLFEEAHDLLGYSRKQRTQGRSRARFSNAREASAEARLLIDDARRLERQAVQHLLGSAKVVCATLSMLGGRLLRDEHFDLVLHDEATQATEPLSLMAAAKSPVIIFAGDPQQLPPTVMSVEAARNGLSTSLFERLMASNADNVKQLLTIQYRMHQQLMQFPSQEMYDGKLEAHATCATRGLDNTNLTEIAPLLFVDTAGKGFDETVMPGTTSPFNEGEAQLLVEYVQLLLGAGLSPQALGVVTPYAAQAAHLRPLLNSVEGLEIDSVDAFQGREKEVIIASLVRSNSAQELGFLKDTRRLNVALTRARRQLVVFGDSATLSALPFLSRFIEHTQHTGGYRSAWEWQPSIN